VKQGLQGGLVPGLLGGLNPSAVSIPTTVDTMTPAGIASIIGLDAPTWMYRGSDSTGALELVGTGEDLANAGTPTHEVTDAALGGLSVTLDNASTDSLKAGDAVAGDVASAAFAAMWVGRITDASGNHSLFGKRQASGGNLGWEMRANGNASIAFYCDTSGGVSQAILAAAHGTTNAQVMLFARRWTANEVATYTREGSSTGTRLQETLANSAILGVGASDVLTTTVGQAFGLLMIWEGAAAEAINNSHRLLVAQHLGYEA
jgi:hypothetical protein